eukprot:EG_transcript_33667
MRTLRKTLFCPHVWRPASKNAQMTTQAQVISAAVYSAQAWRDPDGGLDMAHVLRGAPDKWLPLVGPATIFSILLVSASAAVANDAQTEAGVSLLSALTLTPMFGLYA